MAILYRAMWADDGRGDLTDVAEAFGARVAHKSGSAVRVPVVGPGFERRTGRRPRSRPRARGRVARDPGGVTRGRLTLDDHAARVVRRGLPGPARPARLPPPLGRRARQDPRPVRGRRDPRAAPGAGAAAGGPRCPTARPAVSPRVQQFNGHDGAELLAERITAFDRDIPVVVAGHGVADHRPCRVADRRQPPRRRQLRAGAGAAAPRMLDEHNGRLDALLAEADARPPGARSPAIPGRRRRRSRWR